MKFSNLYGFIDFMEKNQRFSGDEALDTMYEQCLPTNDEFKKILKLALADMQGFIVSGSIIDLRENWQMHLIKLVEKGRREKIAKNLCDFLSGPAHMHADILRQRMTKLSISR